MKKLLLIFIVNISVLGHAFAQSTTDLELQRLIKNVADLRQADMAQWNKTLEYFKNDSLWTTMYDLERDENEYWLVDDNQFALNIILDQRNGHDKKEVPGLFLNGDDYEYEYALTERGIRGMSSVSYEMEGRTGRQTFVVMPYTLELGEKLTVKAFLNGNQIGVTTIDKGNIVLNINANVKKSDIIRLVITNRNNENLPVVIINHNTRKP